MTLWRKPTLKEFRVATPAELADLRRGRFEGTESTDLILQKASQAGLASIGILAGLPASSDAVTAGKEILKTRTLSFIGRDEVAEYGAVVLMCKYSMFSRLAAYYLDEARAWELLAANNENVQDKQQAPSLVYCFSNIEKALQRAAHFAYLEKETK